MTHKKKQYPDAFMYGNDKSNLITIQKATPAAYALLFDQPADSHGCIHLSETAVVPLLELIDGAGLWLRPL